MKSFEAFLLIILSAITGGLVVLLMVLYTCEGKGTVEFLGSSYTCTSEKIAEAARIRDLQARRGGF